jgi:hypothetical protein
MLLPLIALLGVLVAPSSDPDAPDSLAPAPPEMSPPQRSALSEVQWQRIGTDLAVGGAIVGTIGTISWLANVAATLGDDVNNHWKCNSSQDSTACSSAKVKRSDIPPFLIKAGFGTLAAGLLIKLVAPADRQDPVSLDATPRLDGLDAQVRWRF